MKDKTNLTGLNPDNFRSVINGKDTGLYILRNGSGMEMCVTNYGAIVLSIMAPDSHGKFENVVIGFDTLEEAQAKQGLLYRSYYRPRSRTHIARRFPCRRKRLSLTA